MEYPVVLEDIISAFEHISDMDKILHHIVPMVNQAYFDGLRGRGGWPIDPEEFVKEYVMSVSKEIGASMRSYIVVWVLWCNDAYMSGLREGESRRTVNHVR